MEIAIIVIVLALDQISKYLTDLYLTPLGTSLPVINGVFEITRAHNTGAAWGMLPGRKWFFLLMTLIVCAFLVYFLIRYRKQMTVLARITLSLLLAGALGNAIDRAILGYVRDMFYFSLINFPVFNVADSALTVGCVLLIIDLLFMKDRSVFDIRLNKESRKTSSAKGDLPPQTDKQQPQSQEGEIHTDMTEKRE